MNKKIFEESKQIKEMVENGASFGEIGRKFGISKQAAYQRYANICAVENGVKTPQKYKTLNKIKYKEVRDILYESNLSFSYWIQSMGFTKAEERSLRPFLYGQQSLNLPLLIRFLKATGLTFEEAFMEDFNAKED